MALESREQTHNWAEVILRAEGTLHRVELPPQENRLLGCQKT